MRIHLDLFLAFLRIGSFTLGGGFAMLPLIQREVVDNKQWLGDRDFLNILAIAQSLPGPIAVNTATFVGYRTRGLSGAAAAVLGAVLPSFVCMAVVASFFVNLRHNPHVAAAFAGIRPAVAALIAAAVWNMGRKTTRTAPSLALALGAAAAVWAAGLSPAWVILALAAAGALRPRKEQADG